MCAPVGARLAPVGCRQFAAIGDSHAVTIEGRDFDYSGRGGQSVLQIDANRSDVSDLPHPADPDGGFDFGCLLVDSRLTNCPLTGNWLTGYRLRNECGCGQEYP
jgi:hypothetical protein